ncbi:MAG: ROK family protein [Spartobacteria bacterium]|nr:ROK family protein [Spartobacteria bacterium]
MNDNIIEHLVSGKPQLNRRINASIVLNRLRNEGPLSRADLAKITGIRSTSISAIVEELAEKNMVHEIGRGKSTGGRHPIMLAINPAGLYAAGIEIAEEALNGVIIDLSGVVVASKSMPIPDTRPETICRVGHELISALAPAARIERDDLASVGVALPGIINRRDGQVILSRPLDWRLVPLKNQLESAWQARIILSNNAMAGAMSEYFGGSGAGVNSLLYVMVNLKHLRHYELTSLGCGIVLDGRSYCGEGQIAGEVRVDIEHPLETASRVFPQEAFASTEALFAATRNDRDKFKLVWDAFASQLAVVIARGVDFLSPGRVVIGTDAAELEECIGVQVRDEVHRKTVTGVLEDMEEAHASRLTRRIGFSLLDPWAIARGAIIPQLQELSLAPLLGNSVFL